MLKPLFFISAIFICQVCTARQDTLYFNNQWLKSAKDSAEFFRVYTKAHGLYKTTDYRANGKIYRTGYRTSLASDNFTYQTGPYVLYDTDGFKLLEGDYDHGYLTGSWKYYFRHSETIKTELFYEKSELTGHALTYDSATHKVIKDVAYIGKHMTKTTRYEDGDTLISVEKFSGILREEDQFYKSGKLKNKTTYNGNFLVTAECYDETGKNIDCPARKKQDTGKIFSYVEQMPIAGYDINNYLGQNLHYPDQAREHNIQGRVILKFVVDEDGSISDVHIVRGFDAGCDAEAERVVAEMPPWQPGTQNGVPVRVYFTLPIVFKVDSGTK